MKRKNWEAAKTFFAQQGKVASENAPTAEDLREIGFTGTEIEKFEMASRKMAADFYQELHKLAMTEGTGGDKAMTGPDSHGVTPLQAEQGSKEGPNPGTAVHTDHAEKDPYFLEILTVVWLLGVPAMSRILTADSQKLSLSILRKVPFLIF